MPRQEIELGTAPGGEDGDSARAAFARVNEMTAELYAADAALAGRAAALEGRATLVEGRTTTLEGRATAVEERTDALESETGALADNKVDKVAGKELSANDFTDELYEKLSTIEGSKFQGLFVSLEALQLAIPVGQAGWYAHIDPGTGGENTALAIWDDDDAQWILHESAGEMTPAQILAALLANPDVNVLSDNEYDKLAGVQPEATKNSADAQLRDRSTHTGTQLASSISDLAAAVRAVDLTGLPVGTNEPIAATDTVLIALAKLQEQIGQVPEAVGGELGATEFYSGRRTTLSTARPGRAPADGQLLDRAVNADLWAFVQENYVVVADAAWLNTSAQLYGYFSDGDGSTTFRLPDWNGAVAGHKRRVPRGTAGDGGGLTEDQLGPMKYVNSTYTSATTVFLRNLAGYTATLPRNGTGGGLAQDTPVDSASDGTKWVTNTGDETRAASIDGIWLIRIASGGSNPGTVDVTELNSEQIAQGARIATLESGRIFVSDSGPMSFVSAGYFTVNHNLPVKPKITQLWIRITSTWNTYQAGQEFPAATIGFDSSTTSVVTGARALTVNESIIFGRFGSTTEVVYPGDMTSTPGGTAARLPAANFEYFYRCIG